MINFNLNGYYAYVITDSENGCFINDGLGYYMEADQMLELGKKLVATAKKKGVKQALIEHNIQHEIDKQQYWESLKNEPKFKKPKRKSQVYLMECGGKYKIGVSANVSRRCKQLDNRPFPVNVIATSPFIENAYRFEEDLHQIYNNFRIDGEWFNFSKQQIEKITTIIGEADEIYD